MSTEYQWKEKPEGLNNSILGNDFLQGINFFKKMIPKEQRDTRSCFTYLIWYGDSIITANGHYLIKYQLGKETERPISLPGGGMKEAEKTFDLLKPVYMDIGIDHLFISQADKLLSLDIGDPKIPVSAIDIVLDSDPTKYRMTFDPAEVMPILKNAVKELKTNSPKDFYCKLDTGGKLTFEINGETITKQLNVSKTMSYGCVSIDLYYLSQLISLFKHGQITLTFSVPNKPLKIRCSGYPVEIYLMPMIR